MIVDDEARLGGSKIVSCRESIFSGKHIINGIFSRSLGWTKSSGKGSNLCPWVIKHVNGSDVRARLGSARPDDGLRKSKPEPQAPKSLSRPKPWAQAAALHT